MDSPTLYCEQFGTLATQGLNGGSSVIFILVALLAVWYIYTTQRALRTRGLVLAGLLALIGVGSFLWHMFPTPWTDLVDTLSIVVFAVSGMYVTLGTFFANMWTRISILGYLLVAAYFLEQLPHLNGSAVYLFLLALLGCVCFLLYKKKKPTWRFFLWASILFVFAIAARILDPIVCSAIPIGLHFVWHVLVAGVGGLVIAGLALHQTAQDSHQK